MILTQRTYILLSLYFLCCKADKFGIPFLRSSEDPWQDLLNKLTTNSIEDASRVEYWLYTPDLTVKLSSAATIDSSKPVNILLHGWRGNKSASYIEEIKSAYLERYGSDHTIIVVDYGMYVDGFYPDAYRNVFDVADNFGSFLCELTNDIDPNNIHIIGHSLGAHVAGIAGWYLQKNCERTIGRITGLDPASVGFSCHQCKTDRLDSVDAKFVDVIHTDSLLYGTAIQSGHVDFYVNGGGPLQPGCLTQSYKTDSVSTDKYYHIALKTSICNHSRSCYYFAESIKLNSFLATSCQNDTSTEECTFADQVHMGEYCNKLQRYRTYYVSTKSHFPYGYGPNGSLN